MPQVIASKAKPRRGGVTTCKYWVPAFAGMTNQVGMTNGQKFDFLQNSHYVDPKNYNMLYIELHVNKKTYIKQ